MLDDDQQLIDHWGIRVQELGYPCVGFTSPYEAMDYIRAQPDFSLRDLTLLSAGLDPAEKDSVVYGLDVELSNLISLLKDQSRYQTVGSLIIDYAMPVMTGLEFSEQLSRPDVAKILLTGKADEQLAVKAFNGGVIKKFIMKNTPELELALNQGIQDLQFEYFSMQSDFIYNVYENSLEMRPFLQDSKVIKWFKAYLAKHEIKEFYLISEGGYIDFLMVDKYNQTRWLAMRDDYDLKTLGEVSENEKIQNKTHCPIFKNRKELLSVPEEWPELCIEIQPIPDIELGVYFGELLDYVPAQLSA